MTQNNIYMEDENLVLYVDVLPDIQDTVTAASSSASASAASASASAATASGLVESIRNIKSGAEVFVSQAIESLHDLYNNIQTELNSLMETIVQNINTVYGQKIAGMQQEEGTISARIRTLGSGYVNEARDYAEAAQEIVDFHVSTEHLNQSKAIETGDLSDDLTVFQKVRSYAHSTYDSTKLTVTGSPTVTADGIASGFSSSNYLSASIAETYDIISHTYTFGAKYTYATGGDGCIARFGRFWLVFDAANTRIRLQGQDADNASKNFVNIIIPTSTDGDVYYITGSFGDSGNVKSLSVSINGGTPINGTVTTNTPNLNTVNQLNINVGINSTSIPMAYGYIDLKYLWFKTDGVLTFSCNQTGADAYTIGGSTVSIPYTLSKTGSKIADASQRTNITALYNQQGYAPYYTLDEVSGNFTLPCGEIYGMLENLRKQIDELAT